MCKSAKVKKRRKLLRNWKKAILKHSEQERVLPMELVPFNCIRRFLTTKKLNILKVFQIIQWNFAILGLLSHLKVNKGKLTVVVSIWSWQIKNLREQNFNYRKQVKTADETCNSLLALRRQHIRYLHWRMLFCEERFRTGRSTNSSLKALTRLWLLTDQQTVKLRWTHQILKRWRILRVKLRYLLQNFIRSVSSSSNFFVVCFFFKYLYDLILRYRARLNATGTSSKYDFSNFK